MPGHVPFPSEGIPLSMFGDTPLTIVEDTATLESLVAKLESRPVIGVDIEADSFHHYKERVCLIQVSDVDCLLYTSPSPRDLSTSRMPSSA